MIKRNFTIRELTRSNTAIVRGIDNSPSMEVMDNLDILIDKVLQPTRDAIGRPIRVTSGYRCPELNEYLKGAKNSHHIKGMAADFICKDLYKTFLYVKDCLSYTQLIYETSHGKSWVHVSYDKDNLKQETLIYKNGKYTRIQ